MAHTFLQTTKFLYLTASSSSVHRPSSLVSTLMCAPNTSCASKFICLLIPDRDSQVTVNLRVIGKGDVKIGTILGG